MVTNILYDFAESHSFFGNTRAGFRKQKDTIHQLQNIIIALEDAKGFKQEIYALIVNFIYAFNTTDHDRMLIIMYELGFPTDAIDIVKGLYQGTSTKTRLPFGGNTKAIPMRGTIQENTMFPILFLFIHGTTFALTAHSRQRLQP